MALHDGTSDADFFCSDAAANAENSFSEQIEGGTGRGRGRDREREIEGESCLMSD